MEPMDEPEDVVRAFVAAYGRDDRDEVRRLLADDVVAFVTNADAGVDRVDGPDGYLARLPSLDGAELRIEVTQSVRVAPDQALTMVRIVAEREGRSLHNFGAFLSRTRGGQLTEIWMVDAEPAYSDEFWS
jgi:ketosteroid isomerase-like protein